MNEFNENNLIRIAKGQTHSPSGRFKDLDSDKLRGGYYTSPQLAIWLAKWAIRNRQDIVLEPSCGQGVFLEAAARRLSELGNTSKSSPNLTGIEIIAREAEKARALLRPYFSFNVDKIVKTADFFAWWQSPERPAFDTVIGNPPFIRYQSFPEPYRNRAMSIMGQLGMTPNRLTNMWVPFVAAAVASLRPGGRLAFVLPAELLQVSYASQLRCFLTDRFASIDIVACNELFFDNAEQEVVLLLADNAQEKPSPENSCRVTMTEAHTVAEILSEPPQKVLSNSSPKTVRHDAEKWLKYFLTNSEITFMRALRDSSVTTPLKTHATVDIGVVTGKNDFFVLNNEQLENHQLNDYTIPLVSRTAHLKGAHLKLSEWRTLAADGNRVHLLHLAESKGIKLSRSLIEYISSGEKEAFNKGYKCSIRTPWYAVPSVWIPDAFIFRQIYDFPRAILNSAKATSTDTIHRVTCKTKPERVVTNIYTHLTAASAEIEGRSYGGGVLELEPTEAERLLMPAHLGPALSLVECDNLIRAGQIDQVLKENDRLILREQIGLSRSDCMMLRNIWIKMRDRRLARRRKQRSPESDDTAA
jgi:adenine-specific DNA-methyltransferase